MLHLPKEINVYDYYSCLSEHKLFTYIEISFIAFVHFIAWSLLTLNYIYTDTFNKIPSINWSINKTIFKL